MRDNKCLRRRHDLELLSGLVYHPDFANPYAFVGANAVITSWRSIECDNVLRLYADFCSAGGGPPRLLVRTSSSASATNASKGRVPRSPAERLRTETAPSAASRSPVTS